LEFFLKNLNSRRSNRGTSNLKRASTPYGALQRADVSRRATTRRIGVLPPPPPPTRRLAARTRPTPSFGSPCPEQHRYVLPHVPAPASTPAGPPAVPPAIDVLSTLAAARLPLIPPPPFEAEPAHLLYALAAYKRHSFSSRACTHPPPPAIATVAVEEHLRPIPPSAKLPNTSPRT
jgi:hypothetical protein